MRASRPHSRLTANYDLTVATFLLLLCCFVLLNAHIKVGGPQVQSRLRQAVYGFTHQEREESADLIAGFGLIRDLSCATCPAYRRWQGKLALFEEGSAALSETGARFIATVQQLSSAPSTTITLDWPISGKPELDAARTAALGALLEAKPAQLHLGVGDQPHLTLELEGEGS